LYEPVNGDPSAREREIILRMLTQREKGVLAAMTLASTEPEVAAMLGISVRTLQRVLEDLRAKLGV